MSFERSVVRYTEGARIAVALLLGLALGCGGGDGERREGAEARKREGPLVVFAAALPLQYFAQRIGGDAVEVHFPVPAGADPAEWSPGAEVVAAYQAADLVLVNGGGYAKWLARASLPRRSLVDTSSGFPERLLADGVATRHAHGPEGAHAHTGVAPMAWLDPELAIAQARAIAAAFAAARPESGDRFERGFEALARDLRELDRRFEATAAALAGAPLIFSHPVYPYFIERYGLNAHSLHWEPHTAPSEAMWAEFGALQSEHPARWLLWEAPPLPAVAAELERLGVRSRVLDPCGIPSDSGDYLERMLRNADVFEELPVNRDAGSRVESAGEERDPESG